MSIRMRSQRQQTANKLPVILTPYNLSSPSVQAMQTVQAELKLQGGKNHEVEEGEVAEVAPHRIFSVSEGEVANFFSPIHPPAQTLGVWHSAQSNGTRSW